MHMTLVCKNEAGSRVTLNYLLAAAANIAELTDHTKSWSLTSNNIQHTASMKQQSFTLYTKKRQWSNLVFDLSLLWTTPISYGILHYNFYSVFSGSEYAHICILYAQQNKYPGIWPAEHTSDCMASQSLSGGSFLQCAAIENLAMWTLVHEISTPSKGVGKPDRNIQV